MKFSIPKGGKNILSGVKFISIAEGVFETKDKELQAKLSKCKGVSEIKDKSK